MGFSSRSHYGVRAMLELAIRSGEGPVHLETLAEVQRLPERYLAKIVQDLRRGGLIRSVRGAGGGYMLARDPSAIKLVEVVPAVVPECAELRRSRGVDAGERRHRRSAGIRDPSGHGGAPRPQGEGAPGGGSARGLRPAAVQSIVTGGRDGGRKDIRPVG